MKMDKTSWTYRIMKVDKTIEHSAVTIIEYDVDHMVDMFKAY